MISLAKGFLKFLSFIINLLFVLQITLLILIFFTAAYWFFNLIEIHIFDFAEPIANCISDLIRLFYTQDIEVGGIYIDGSLLLFDFIALILIFMITKFKYFLYKTISNVEIYIQNCLKRLEDNFNKELQKEIEESVKKSNDLAVLIKFKVKNMFVDACWGGDKEDGAKEKEQEAYKILYSALKTFEGCKFAKSGDNLLIFLTDFEKTDSLMIFLYSAIERLQYNMQKKHWKLTAYISVDVYNDKTDNFREEVLPILDALLDLKNKNVAVCLGNFGMRYELLKNQEFYLSKRGLYNIVNCENEVWTLVKKS